MTNLLSYPSLPVIPCEDRCLDTQTPPEARPCSGFLSHLITRYDWKILEDWGYDWMTVG